MRRMRGAAYGTTALAIAVGLACGTSHPALIVLDSQDAGPVPQPTPMFDDAAGSGQVDPYFDCEPADAGLGQCPCRYVYSTGLIVELTCNGTVCSDGKMETAHCTGDGHLIIVPNFAYPYCGEAGAPVVPQCEAGALPILPH